MTSLRQRLLWVAICAVAMALLEAVVVVYLRGLITIGSDHVTLGGYLRYERWREVGTLVMLIAVGVLAGRRWRERLSYSLFAFGLWDIGYYAWLRFLIGWPESVWDWDILFLIPFRWWGPVLAPLLVAALLVLGTMVALLRLERGQPPTFSRLAVVAATLGLLLALYTFMADSLHAWLRQQPDWHLLRPAPFRWPLFLLSLALLVFPPATSLWPRLRLPSIALAAVRVIERNDE